MRSSPPFIYCHGLVFYRVYHTELSLNRQVPYIQKNAMTILVGHVKLNASDRKEEKESIIYKKIEADAFRFPSSSLSANVHYVML